jgi:hypothetical protein
MPPDRMKSRNASRSGKIRVDRNRIAQFVASGEMVLIRLWVVQHERRQQKGFV